MSLSQTKFFSAALTLMVAAILLMSCSADHSTSTQGLFVSADGASQKSCSDDSCSVNCSVTYYDIGQCYTCANQTECDASLQVVSCDSTDPTNGFVFKDWDGYGCKGSSTVNSDPVGSCFPTDSGSAINFCLNSNDGAKLQRVPPLASSFSAGRHPLKKQKKNSAK